MEPGNNVLKTSINSHAFQRKVVMGQLQAGAGIKLWHPRHTPGGLPTWNQARECLSSLVEKNKQFREGGKVMEKGTV